tara:strand:- start:13962 stop:15572 length:1611 start_codon:yes stop_codon:yes gene_type:complete
MPPAGMMSRSKLKNVDFYRKIPKDMTEGTIPGSVISLVASVVIGMLLISEISTYITPAFNTRVVVDRSLDGDLMRINFNVSFPALSCEFASVDVGDAMGLNRYNLTKTVFKRPIDSNLNPLGPIQWERGEHKKDPKHADDLQVDKAAALVKYHDDLGVKNPGSVEPVVELTARSFEGVKKDATVLLVNFYAPWCPWSRRLDPVWKAAALEVHKKYPKTLKNRVLLAEVDCTKHEQLCVAQHIQGYPSVRVYTKGSDAVNTIGGAHDHASYHGDRTVEAITKFATDLLPEWKASDDKHVDSVAVVRDPKESHGESVKKIDGPGCSVTGFVLVKKVPGHLWITASSDSHSFHPEQMNTSHVVHHFYFGQQLSPSRKKYLEKFHSGVDALGVVEPVGSFGGSKKDQIQTKKRNPQTEDWHDKLANTEYLSEDGGTTHEHYLQTVLTTIKPWGANSGFNVYEYTQHSHFMKAEKESPRAKFFFDPSPMQIYVTEERQKFYHFITTLMAIVGGVYSVMGIADGFVHNGLQMLRKNSLGKQG